jgi:isochorismate synthase EntC
VPQSKNFLWDFLLKNMLHQVKEESDRKIVFCSRFCLTIEDFEIPRFLRGFPGKTHGEYTFPIRENENPYFQLQFSRKHFAKALFSRHH